MSYIAYLCYPYNVEEDDLWGEEEPKIKFEEPEEYRYEKVIPIQFSVIHEWTHKDKELYK